MVAAESLACFMAYDIRGRLGDEFNQDIAWRIGHAYAKHLGAKRVVVGGDIRHSSALLKQALAQGLMAAGADVVDIGMVGTEEVYFASFYLDVDGGIEVTASHNPIDYNGMKLVRRGALPISGDSGLREIQRIAEGLTSPYAGSAEESIQGLAPRRSGFNREHRSFALATEVAPTASIFLDLSPVIAIEAKQSSQTDTTPSPLRGEGGG